MNSIADTIFFEVRNQLVFVESPNGKDMVARCGPVFFAWKGYLWVFY